MRTLRIIAAILTLPSWLAAAPVCPANDLSTTWALTGTICGTLVTPPAAPLGRPGFPVRCQEFVSAPTSRTAGCVFKLSGFDTSCVFTGINNVCNACESEDIFLSLRVFALTLTVTAHTFPGSPFQIDPLAMPAAITAGAATYTAAGSGTDRYGASYAFSAVGTPALPCGGIASGYGAGSYGGSAGLPEYGDS